MECNHSCDCCEILCADAIKKHNEAVIDQADRIKSLESELERVKKENLGMRNFMNCKHHESKNAFCELTKKSYDKCPCDKWEIKGE